MISDMTAASKSKILKELIVSDDTLLVPDAFDAISAKLIESTGYKSVQCSGMSFSISSCCLNESELTLAENLEITRKIVNAVEVPVMADGEDGYGTPERVGEVVNAFITTGVAGINVEDQILSGTEEGRIIDLEIMKEKIRSAKGSAKEAGNPDFVVNARTDVIHTQPNRNKAIDEAILRANEFIEAGADMAFVTYVNTREELAELKQQINGPISISAGIPYLIPDFTIQDCIDLQVNRVSFPTALIFGSIQGMKMILEEVMSKKDLHELYRNDAFCTPNYVKDVLSP